MRCPLMKETLTKCGTISALVPAACPREMCSWWHIGGKRCSMLSIAATLLEIEGEISKLATIINERRFA